MTKHMASFLTLSSTGFLLARLLQPPGLHAVPQILQTLLLHKACRLFFLFLKHLSLDIHMALLLLSSFCSDVTKSLKLLLLSLNKATYLNLCAVFFIVLITTYLFVNCLSLSTVM